MKKVFKISLISVGSIILLLIVLLIIINIFGQGSLLLPVAKKDTFDIASISSHLSMLRCNNNVIVDAQDNKIFFKGIMVPDLQKMDKEKKFNKEYFQNIFSAGGNVIRVPVHPDRWISDEYYLWRYLDKVVASASDNDQYVIIDLHFIGNILTGSGSEMVDVGENAKDFTVKFWKQVATYFKDTPNVIFEIVNEPTSISATDWSTCANEIVKEIRNTGANQLIIVGGIDYSYDLSWVKTSPIQDNNIAYAAHVYPSKKDWDYYFGEVSKSYPVIVTEWGYMDENRADTKQKYLVGTENDFGKPLMDYMAEHDIGWVACWYDDGWEPPMFTKDFKAKTNWGKFIFDSLDNNQ